jgi:hypothetical protein
MIYLPSKFLTLVSPKAPSRSKLKTNPQPKMFKTKAPRKSNRNQKNPTKVIAKQ